MTTDKNFSGVLRACAAAAPGREDTWINDPIVSLYQRLHGMGYAHSVECWQDDKMVGGLYGVALEGAFFGESMFSTARDASKVALVHLVERLNERGFVLLDTQANTPHLKRFGCVEIPAEEYLRRLRAALKKRCAFG